MIEARAITKMYGHLEVLHETSFVLRPGEICGYLGPNGSGKSTTVQILTGLTPATRGEVLLDGRPIAADLEAYKRRLGYVPEEARVYRHLSGREYLELVGGLRGIPPTALRTRMHALLDAFGLASDADVPLDEYSKGMRQKILLAAALLHDPEILILDEPFSGLDVTTVLIVRALLQALAARGRTILLTSHELEIMQQLCERVMVIYRGRIVADDNVANLQSLMALPDQAQRRAGAKGPQPGASKSGTRGVAALGPAPTLEAVFTQLTDQRDVARRGDELAQLLSGGL